MNVELLASNPYSYSRGRPLATASPGAPSDAVHNGFESTSGHLKAHPKPKSSAAMVGPASSSGRHHHAAMGRMDCSRDVQTRAVRRGIEPLGRPSRQPRLRTALSTCLPLSRKVALDRNLKPGRPAELHGIRLERSGLEPCFRSSPDLLVVGKHGNKSRTPFTSGLHLAATVDRLSPN